MRPNGPSTASLRRTFDDLVGYLMRADIHPDGVVLATGTCLVPPRSHGEHELAVHTGSGIK